MSRRPRTIIPGCPYHITARGNHRAAILSTDDECAMYMSILTRWAKELGIQVGCFSLMSTHVHLAAVSPTETALSDWLENAHRDYSKWFNAVRERKGHNWDRRFFSTLMDEQHCLNALRYIERNPVTAGLVQRAWQWRWSSAAWHSGTGPKPSILNVDLRPTGTSCSDWRELLLTETPEDFNRKLEECIRRNAPLADDAWLTRLEAKTGLSLRPRPRGRPRTRVEIGGVVVVPVPDIAAAGHPSHKR